MRYAANANSAANATSIRAVCAEPHMSSDVPQTNAASGPPKRYINQSSRPNETSDGMTYGQMEKRPNRYVSRSTAQKCSGGLCVNGEPFSVGRKNEPARISRTTWLYFVSSPM